MQDANLNAAPDEVTGQAPAPDASTQGQAVEQKSGQVAVGTPGGLGDFKTPEELYKSYQELRKDYTQTKQQAAELAKEAETLAYLRSDPRFQTFAKETYETEQPKQIPQTDEILEELNNLGIPAEKLDALLDKKAEAKFQAFIQRDPVYQVMKKSAIDFAFKEAEDSGIKDIRNYKDKIGDFYRANPDLQNLPLAHVYKIVAFDDAPNKVKAEQQQINQSKRNASTEGPGMTITQTAPVIRTLGDSFRYEMGKK